MTAHRYEAGLAKRRTDTMSLHTLHPDAHEYGLADGCPRCAEHALQPLGLDIGMLSELRQRVSKGLRARSQNETIAMQRLREARQLWTRCPTDEPYCPLCGAPVG
jgi:hypothetical protein